MSHNNHYLRLLLMAILSFVSMYILMYAMVDELGNVWNNLNQVYMAGLMTAPMVLFEIWLMRPMYQDQRLNLVIAALAVVAGLAGWFGIRGQVVIDDVQFLRSMIPHHAGAVLMCEQAQLTDLELVSLCEDIIEGQKAEIELMTNKLKEVK